METQINNEIKDQVERYEDEEFQTLHDDSYVSKIQNNFTLNYQTSTQQNIQHSLNQMRNMMKVVSKILDEKIHKYYGLMGTKHHPDQKDQNVLVQKLRKQKDTNQKLIQVQLSQIKQIQVLDIEMSSNKRIQKQAERLKQYFQTKKAMIQADKQTRFSQGEISKAAQYLARDLDVERYYFRLNKIKQDLEYAMLRQRQISTKNRELQKQLQDKQVEYGKMSQIYDKKMMVALKNKLLLPQNKQVYQNHRIKQQLLNRKGQIKKKINIQTYNLNKSIQTLQMEISSLRKKSNQYQIILNSSLTSINSTQHNILQIQQKDHFKSKFSKSLFLQNINLLIKNKKLLNSSKLIQNKQSSNQDSKLKKPLNDLTQSSIFMKPNFKIKRSKSKWSPQKTQNKSMDLKKTNLKIMNMINVSQVLTSNQVLLKNVKKRQTVQINQIKNLEKQNITPKSYKNPEQQ